MLSVDAAAFYDLPEAGRRLFADPVRLAREAAARAIPAGRRDGAWILPRAWVDAAAGASAADAEALRASWLERLAPPSFAARRSLCPRTRLPAGRLLDADAAGRALACDRARLERLAAEGTLPVLRVDGEPCFDADLVEALADEAGGAPAAAARAAARRALVTEWSTFEYASEPAAPPAPPPARGAPQAYEVPRDLARADGFETVDDEGDD